MGFKKVAVLGVGLIGASLARSLKRHSMCGHVSGYGRAEERLKRAAEEGIIDSYSTDPMEACRSADLVVFATPPGRFESLTVEVAGSLKAGTAAIDVGSIKGAMVYRMEELMPEGVRFLGCHPIAGSEQSGFEASRDDLFEDAACIITPTEKTDPALKAAISSLWEKMGARVFEMSPEKHDRIFGLVSHFPHLAAFALVSSVSKVEADSLRFAGQGFMDTTRIALSSPSLWRDICMMNRENVLLAIEAFKHELDSLGAYLREGDAAGLEDEMAKARDLRRQIEG